MADIFTAAATPIHGVKRGLAIAAAGSVVIPQGAVVERIYIRNNTANAVTGGIKIGTTLGGTDVLAAGAVAASALVAYSPLIGGANTAADRTLYIDAVTAWNSASVDVAVSYTDLV
ncbi:hypothetical protein [Bradyrhizobium retamae]|uniref:Uncharacterized protein n=1 Tax=Bradyrhizobium retamae TaxID=1300035 RepID=A0A0R3MPX4_9BRAD|nr:hypothetical protein [Bradyrhizobium retamae]KRR22153.1 hypothetical protein CQ13_29940 [Bradyrhizobium retamae]